MERLSNLAGRLAPYAAAVFLVVPVAAALWFGLTAGGGETWDHVLQNRLVPYTFTTLAVLALTALFILGIAVPAAWLVSAYDFPGRGIFDWALILPLAMPGYVMAYAWADLAGVAGPVQSSFRDLTGLSARDYWFPDIFTPTGLAFILASTLFPYVYITARAAFTNQSLATLEAARSLGASGARLFLSVALPSARPAIVAGLALALMEAAADFGAADFLGIQTLGVGIVRAWSSFGEPATAARLAVVLVSIAFLFFFITSLSRGRATNQQTANRWLTPTRTRLTGQSGWIASLFCGGILLVAFFLPITRLVWLLLETGAGTAPIMPPLLSSIILGLSGATLAIICALAIIVGAKHANATSSFLRLSVAAGYAAPGAVLGLGGLFLLSATGQSLSGVTAIFLLVGIYASRFTSAGLEPMRAAFERAPISLDYAARSLGASNIKRFTRVDLPLILPGVLAGGLILCVEILKELPATLMLRPFGWDTLAVRAHAYASDERLAEATLPSLLITLAGLAPVLLLSWRLSKTGHTIE